MPDAYTPSRAPIDAEFADMRPALDRVALRAQSLISALRDIPRPLFANERRKSDIAREAFAEEIANRLDDLMGDLLGPVRGRADDGRIEPDEFTIDLSEVWAELELLSKECNSVCVTERKARR